MARFIPYDLRKLIVLRRQSKISYQKIHEELGYSISGIKKIWYQYQKEGEPALRPNYDNCGRKSSYSQTVHDAIAAIRTGEQGAPYVYSMLKLKYPGLKRPHTRTIQRWWEARSVNRPKGRPSEAEKNRGQPTPTKPGK